MSPKRQAPMLNMLPTIITDTGDYITRDGRRVTIHAITDPVGKGTTSFSAKGSVWSRRRGVDRPRGLEIWHISGRAFPLDEDPSDIVGLWPSAG